MKYSAKSVAIVAVGGVLTIAGLIWIVFAATRSPSEAAPASGSALAMGKAPQPAAWNYEAYAGSLPLVGKITQNILPKALSSYMEKAPRSIVTASSPVVSAAEKAAADEAMQLRGIWSEQMRVNRLELKWGVVTVHMQDGKSRVYKDVMGTIDERSKNDTLVSTLANWNWAEPTPNGPKNRHAGGLDPVDIAYFAHAHCSIVVVSRGVTNDLQVSFEDFHSLRSTLKTKDGGKPMVLVADSAMCVDVINELIASKYSESLCFLLHSTC